MKVTPVKRSAATTLTPQQLTALWGMAEDWTDLHAHGYRRLSECPEVISAVDRIASLGSMMTIRMMQNTKEGDIRVKDALSRKIDMELNALTEFTILTCFFLSNLLRPLEVSLYCPTFLDCATN